MKRKTQILALFLCAILTGCSSTGNETGTADTSDTEKSGSTELTELSTLYENQSELQQTILANSYVNFSFTEDFTLTIPDTQTVSRFQLTDAANDATDEELLAYASDALEKYFSDLYTEEELNAFLEEGILQEEIFFLENDEIGLTVYRNGYVHAYNRGIAMALDENSTPANVYMPAGEHEILQSYDVDRLDSADSYLLTDGECTVAEAVEQTNTLLQENSTTDLLPTIKYVYAVQLTDSVCVYQMNVDMTYFNMPFDFFPSVDGTFKYRTLEEDTETAKNYDNLSGNVVVSQQGYIDFQISVKTDREIDVQEASESCISPETALEYASDYLSENITFTVDSLELLYASYTISEADDNAEQTQVDPVWKLHAYNANDGRYYVLYVDALTGYCDNSGFSYAEDDV